MSPRDNQRQRLYDSEGATGPDSRAFERYVVNGPKVASTGNRSIEAVQAYVDHVTSAAWFQSRWGSRKITARHKVHGHATAHRSRIMLPPWARTEADILHEMAHCLTPDTYANHGPEYAGILLTLIRYAKGAEAAAMQRANFKTKRVRYSMKAVPSPLTKPVVLRSEQERQKVARARQEREEQRKVDTHREMVKRFPERRNAAAETIRALVKDGTFGATGTKSRREALATARTLETGGQP